MSARGFGYISRSRFMFGVNLMILQVHCAQPSECVSGWVYVAQALLLAVCGAGGGVGKVSGANRKSINS